MKKFIKNLIVFLFICVLICSFFVILDIFVVKNQHNQNYNSAMLDKLNRLKSIDEPKIIIIGDSNMAFGINSKIIEEELSMPVVNLGLHGGIGDTYYEDLIKPYIKEGDIVIIAPYIQEGDEHFPDTALAFTLLEKNKELWEPFEFKKDKKLIRAYPYYVYSCFSKWITFSGNKGESTCYSRDAFNEYGDVIKRPKEYKKATEELFSKDDVIKVPKTDKKFFESINAYNDFVTSKGATLLFTAYPVAKCEKTPTVEEYEKLEKELHDNLNCPIISKYEDYFISTEYFYDTVLHLTSEGADIRTTQLVKDIKAYLNEQ